jgi:hypothetical protein
VSKYFDNNNQIIMNKQKQSPWQIVFFITLFVSLIFGLISGFLKNVISNPYPKSSVLHQPFERIITKINQNPELKKKVLAIKKSSNASDTIMQIAKNGFSKLDNASLVRRLEIMDAILAKLDPDSCAAIAQGQLSEAVKFRPQFIRALEQLDNNSINDWFELSYKALVLSNSSTPQVSVDPKVQAEAFRKLINSLPQPEAEKLIFVFNALGDQSKASSISNSEICTGIRTLSRQTLKLDPNSRDVLAKVFAKQ